MKSCRRSIHTNKSDILTLGANMTRNVNKTIESNKILNFLNIFTRSTLNITKTIFLLVQNKVPVNKKEGAIVCGAAVISRFTIATHSQKYY